MASTQRDGPPSSSSPPAGGLSWSQRHDETVVRAEARHLALALAPYRVLRKQTLERVAGTSRWREGGFDRALGVAIREGLIERLPAGFLRNGRGEPGASGGRAGDTEPGASAGSQTR